jgi:rhamnosyltransferase
MLNYKIAVLMSSYNGEKYIREQIDSILQQKNCNVRLIVRDDGSTDGTSRILNQYAENGQLEYYPGTNLGVAKSFISMVKDAPLCDYYAFADQDDVWMPEKLIQAVELIKSSDKPAAYCSNLRRVDSNLNLVSEHALPDNVRTDFESVMTVSGRIFGCTMLFNHPMVEFIKNRSMPEYVIMHDLWIAMIASLHGNLIYDSRSYINYRTHQSSVTFSKNIPMSKKIKSMFIGSKDKVSKQCEVFVDYVGKNVIKDLEHWKICEYLLCYKYDAKSRWKLIHMVLTKKDMSFKLRIQRSVQIACKKY